MIHTINFSKSQADGVVYEEIKETVRPKRKNPICVGDTLRLRTGMHHGSSRLLREVTCTGVEPIQIYDKATIIVSGRELNAAEIQALARANGHKTRDEFITVLWFQYTFPFVGDVIKWE